MPPACLIKSEQTHSQKQKQVPVQMIFIIVRIFQYFKVVVFSSDFYFLWDRLIYQFEVDVAPMTEPLEGMRMKRFECVAL